MKVEIYSEINYEQLRVSQNCLLHHKDHFKSFQMIPRSVNFDQFQDEKVSLKARQHKLGLCKLYGDFGATLYLTL